MHGKVRDIDIMNSQKLDDICLENLMLKAVNIGWDNKISSNHLYKKTNKVHELYQKEMEYEKEKRKNREQMITADLILSNNPHFSNLQLRISSKMGQSQFEYRFKDNNTTLYN